MRKGIIIGLSVLVVGFVALTQSSNAAVYYNGFGNSTSSGYYATANWDALMSGQTYINRQNENDLFARLYISNYDNNKVILDLRNDTNNPFTTFQGSFNSTVNTSSTGVVDFTLSERDHSADLNDGVNNTPKTSMQLSDLSYGNGIAFGGTNGQHLWGCIADTKADCDNAQSGIPSNYYAQIETAATLNLRNSTDTSSSSNILKTLPADWGIEVTTTTDSLGNRYVSGGYRWFGVIDPTDGVSGWMAATSTSQQFITDYNASVQSDIEASSSQKIATSTTQDENLIFNAIDHYYNNSSTVNSLYSSDDNGNTIGSLASGGFPEQVIPGVAAQEDGGYSFNNEQIAKDFGFGIMQLTFLPLDGGGDFDNRGIASGVTIPPCANTGDSTLYQNCYTNATDTSVFHYYQPDTSVTGTPEFKDYTNTPQSIYSNVKDGLQILANSYSDYSYISTSTTIATTTYSAQDKQDILALAKYNGSCGYVDSVASKLDTINTYFPTATTSGITSLISKMHTAGQSNICIQLHSPATVSIQDSTGKVVGIVNGKAENDFPLAVYNPNGKSAEILAAGDGKYTFKVTGTATGTYGLDFAIRHGNQEIDFSEKGVPVVTKQADTYIVDPNAIARGNGGITLQIDTKGNGKIDKTEQLSGATVINNAGQVIPPPPLKIPPQAVVKPVASSSSIFLNTTSSVSNNNE